jgi:hypothetical protein
VSLTYQIDIQQRIEEALSPEQIRKLYPVAVWQKSEVYKLGGG